MFSDMHSNHRRAMVPVRDESAFHCGAMVGNAHVHSKITSDEPYPHILLFQIEETRYIIEKLEWLKEKNKIVNVYSLMGIIGCNMNNKLIAMLGIEGYYEMIENLGGWYNAIKGDNDCIVIKKTWMSSKNRTLLFEYLSIGTQSK
jgi:hypothetical protein